MSHTSKIKTDEGNFHLASKTDAFIYSPSAFKSLKSAEQRFTTWSDDTKAKILESFDYGVLKSSGDFPSLLSQLVFESVAKIFGRL